MSITDVHKETDKSIVSPYSWTSVTNRYGNVTTTVYDLTHISEIERKSYDGKNIYNFFKLRDDGVIIGTTDLAKNVYKDEKFLTEFKYKSYAKLWLGNKYVPNPNNFSMFFGYRDISTQYSYVEPTALIQQDMDLTRDSCITEALASVTSNKMLIGATFAEMKETTAMLKSAVKVGTSVMKWTNKFISNMKPAKMSYQAFIDTWMNLRMGWRPFLGEVDTLTQTIWRIKENVERRNFKKFAGLSNTHHSTHVGTPGWLYNSAIKFDVSKDSEAAFFCKAGVYAIRKKDGYLDPYGASINALPKTIWEITPFSWAVDYVFNVGDFISAHSVDTYWQPVDKWVVCVEKTTKKVFYGSWRKESTSVYFECRGDGGGRIVSDVKIRRGKFQDVAIVPKYKLNFGQALDLIGAFQPIARKTVTNLATIATNFRSKFPKRRK